MNITKELVEQWVENHMSALLQDLITITNIRSVAEVKDAKVAPFGQGCIDVLEKMLALGQQYGFHTRNYDNYVGCIELNDLDYFTAHYPCPKLSLVPDSGFPVCLGERGTFNGEIYYNEEFSEDIIDLYTPTSPYMLADKATIILRKTDNLLTKIASLPDDIQVRISSNIECTATGIARNAGNPFSEGNKDNALQTLLVALHEHNILNEQNDKLLSLCRMLNTNYDGKALGIDCTDELSGPLVLACVSAKMENRRLKVNFLSRYPISKNDMDFEGITTKCFCFRNRNASAKGSQRPISSGAW